MYHSSAAPGIALLTRLADEWIIENSDPEQELLPAGVVYVVQKKNLRNVVLLLNEDCVI